MAEASQREIVVTDYSSYLEAKMKMTIYVRHTWVRKKRQKTQTPGFLLILPKPWKVIIRAENDELAKA